MKGTITSYKGSRTRKKGNQVIIEVEGLEKPLELINKKVFWTSPAGKKINGVIKALHGNKGRLRVFFEQGMPGQSLGSEVDVNE